MRPPEKEKIIVRDLLYLAAGLFALWGILALGKGLWDAFGGGPEANYFSPAPWQFISRRQWSRYAGFEMAYGLACLGVAWALRAYAPRLPEWVERIKNDEVF